MFPLPQDPQFIKEVIDIWLDDVEDRLADHREISDAKESWKIANALYLKLPAGCGDMALEDRIFQQRVKLSNLTNTTNEDNL
jgi:hypothetical protein